jgi:hypothetical protein
MKRYIVIVAIAVLVGGGCWFFGLDVIPSVVVTLVVAGIGATIRTIGAPAVDVEWPPAPPEPREGARRETSELSWALRPSGVVDDRIIERVRNLAAKSLGRRHLDLADPVHAERIQRLVGAPTYTFLVSRERGRIDLRRLLSELSRLEQLEKSDPAARD